MKFPLHVFYTLGLVCALSLPSFAQDDCDQLCGWWLSEQPYDQWDGKYRSVLLIEGKDGDRRSYLLRMPRQVDFSRINTLTGMMIDAVLTDSSHLSPVLLTLKIELDEKGALKISEQSDRFGLPASPPNLIDQELSIGTFFIRPKGKFEVLDGKLDTENKSIILTNKAGGKVSFELL